MWIFWPDMKVMTININICTDNEKLYDPNVPELGKWYYEPEQ